MVDFLDISHANRLPYLIKIGLVVIGFMMFLPIVSGETVKLLENTDFCEYKSKLDLDYCYSKYEICNSSLSDVQKSIFVFKDEKGIFKTNISSILSKNIEIEDKGFCKEITISAYKNPFANIDNVLCTQSKCYYEWKWWNSSFFFKFPVNASAFGAIITDFISLNDSFGVDFGDGPQYIWCNYTVNRTRSIVGYLYWNDSSTYACVNMNETERVSMDIDEGNETNFGVKSDNLLMWYHLFNNTDNSNYGNNLTNIGAISTISGKIGHAFDFGGDGDRFEAANNSIIDSPQLNNEITIMAWVNPTDFGDDGNIITRVNGYYFRVDTDQHIKVYLTGTSSPGYHESLGSITSGVWSHIAFTWNNVSQTIRFYINGEQDSTATTVSGNLSFGAGDLTIGAETSVSRRFYGRIDEIRVLNDTLSDEEIFAVYNNTVGGENFAPLGDIISLPVNTSILAVPFDVDDFSFSSSSFVEGIRINFNTSRPITNFIVLSSMNIEKITGAGTNIVSARILLDENIIGEEVLRTVTEIGDVGSTGLSPIRFNVSTGIHNMSVQFARSGTGSILVDNIDFNLLSMVSNEEDDIRNNLIGVLYNHSSTSFVNAFNWTMTKTINSSTYITVKQTVNKLTSGLSTLTYRFFNFETNDTSPEWLRSLSGVADIGSVSGVYIDPVELGSHNHSIQSRQTDVGDTVLVNGTLIDFDLVDSGGVFIPFFQESNESTNSSNTVIFGSGLHLLLTENVTIRDGDSFFLSLSTSFNSQTGEQTPTYIINSTQAGCRTEKDRTLADDNDIGNLFIYFICSNLTVNVTYTFDLFLNVESGEIVEQIDESFNGFETISFDITESELPPIPNDITNPLNSSNVTGDDIITWLAFFDPNNDSITYNITLRNLDNSLVSIIGVTTLLSQSINWDIFSPNNYILMVEGCDPSDLCSNSTIIITILELPIIFPPSTRFCEDENVLFIRTSTNTTTNLVSEAVIVDSRTFCQYGCSNWTISTFGNPGCEEGDFWLSLTFIVVLILIILIIRGAMR